MPITDDALTWRTWLGFGIAAGVIAAGAVPLASWTGPEFRPIVGRGAGALLAILVLPRLLRAVRAAADLDMESQVWRLQRVTPSSAQADPAFARLASEIRGALVRPRKNERSQTARSLWSHLRAIAIRQGLQGETIDELISARNRQALLHLIEAIEATR